MVHDMHMPLGIAVFDTLVGRLRLFCNEGYVLTLGFTEESVHEPIELVNLTSRIKKAVQTDDWSNVPVREVGSDFQRKVWAATRAVTFGTTVSYSRLAEMVGQPGAARSVASAVALNEIALYTPCHRIVKSDGTAGSYRWGATKKKWLLDNEYSSFFLHQVSSLTQEEVEYGLKVAQRICEEQRSEKKNEEDGKK